MLDRRKIEEKIRKKEQEIVQFEAKIKEAKVYLQALQDVIKLLPRDRDELSSVVAILRPGSSVARAREAILAKKTPLHVTELLRVLGSEITRESRAAISSSLSAYVRKGEIFTRPGPNIFGLVELGHTASIGSSVEPPDNFGELSPPSKDDEEIPF